MKGVPLTGKEYEEAQKMLDSFKPENLHKRQVKKKEKKNEPKR